VQIFRRDFNVEWEQSAGLESVIADRIFGEAAPARTFWIHLIASARA